MGFNVKAGVANAIIGKYNEYRRVGGKKVTAGFIADELYEVYPAATKGTPGAMKDILDEDGNKTGEEIAAMGVMEGAFTRLLIKAVQELSAKVEALENA